VPSAMALVYGWDAATGSRSLDKETFKQPGGTLEAGHHYALWTKSVSEFAVYSQKRTAVEHEQARNSAIQNPRVRVASTFQPKPNSSTPRFLHVC